MCGRWVEVTEGVFARRYAELDLTVGLVLGTERALVIDTRGDEAQGAELAKAVRSITDLPLMVVLTHAHFDHCFGTRAFGDVPVYAQHGCRAWLENTAEAQRREWVEYYRARGDQETAEALAATRIVLPEILVVHTAELDLGGRSVRLLHPGPGHTDHDLVVHLPEANVLFAGDLVEQGAPPDFTDADPPRWPNALGALLTLAPDVVVPGHGDPVPGSFVAAQRGDLCTVAEICRAVRAGTLTTEDAIALSPYPADTIRAALRR